MSSIPINPHDAPLLANLQAVRRRVKTLSAIFGLGLLLTSAVGALLVISLVDYMLSLPVAARAILLVVALVGWFYLLWTYIARRSAAGCR